MPVPETCECRYDVQAGELTWCLGCREAEEARKVTPRPSRLALLRAVMNERMPEVDKVVVGPAQFTVTAGTPITVLGIRAHLTEAAQLYALPSEGKALKAMRAGRPRWKWFAARLAYGSLALVFAFCALAYAYDAWQSPSLSKGLIPAAWFYVLVAYATARKVRHPFRPVLLRVW